VGEHFKVVEKAIVALSAGLEVTTRGVNMYGMDVHYGCTGPVGGFFQYHITSKIIR
jgi:hypothetical protein